MSNSSKKFGKEKVSGDRVIGEVKKRTLEQEARRINTLCVCLSERQPMDNKTEQRIFNAKKKEKRKKKRKEKKKKITRIQIDSILTLCYPIYPSLSHPDFARRISPKIRHYSVPLQRMAHLQNGSEAAEID